jgi:hypothetical protein
MRSKKPADIRLRHEISDAPRQLQAAIRALAPEHLNLSTDIPRIPADQNAYPVYEKLPIFRETFPMPVLAHGYYQSEWDSIDKLSIVRATIIANRAYFDTVSEALRRPRFQGYSPDDVFVAARQRAAARLLATKSYVLARDGQPLEAVECAKQIFGIASHAKQNGSVIASLISEGIDALGFAAMRSVLFLCPDRADVAGKIDRILTALPEREAPQEVYLQWEAAYYFDTLDEISTGKMGRATRLRLEAVRHAIHRDDYELLNGVGKERQLADIDCELRENQTEKLIAALSPAQRIVWSNLFIQAKADYLESLSRYVAYSKMTPLNRGQKKRRPAPVASAAASKIEHIVRQAGVANGATLDALTFGFNAWNSDSAIDNRTRRNLTIAMARVFEASAKTGEFPVALALPTDPWGTGQLGYRRTSHGALVYSVSRTGKYDGTRTTDPMMRSYRVENSSVAVPNRR